MPQPGYGGQQPDFLRHDPFKDDDETIEKQPLTSGQNFSGGFYPPPQVNLIVNFSIVSYRSPIVRHPPMPMRMGLGVVPPHSPRLHEQH